MKSVAAKQKAQIVKKQKAVDNNKRKTDYANPRMERAPTSKNSENSTQSSSKQLVSCFTLAKTNFVAFRR